MSLWIGCILCIFRWYVWEYESINIEPFKEEGVLGGVTHSKMCYKQILSNVYENCHKWDYNALFPMARIELLDSQNLYVHHDVQIHIFDCFGPLEDLLTINIRVGVWSSRATMWTLVSSHNRLTYLRIHGPSQHGHKWQ